MRRALFFVLLLAPALAGAQTATPTARIAFATGFEHCGDMSAFWSGEAVGTISGSPSIVRTPAPNSDTGNRCQMACMVASGGNCYVEKNIDATGEAGVHIGVRFDGSAPEEPRRYVSFRNSGGVTGGFLAVVESGSGYRLRAYYGDTTSECSASTNDGTSCDPADCTYTEGVLDPACACGEAAVGELTCGDAAYGQTSVLAFGSYYKIGFGQANNLDGAGAGNVKLDLYRDGLPRGAQKRPQGACAGGDNAGFACSLDADCPASTCTVTAVVPIDRVRIGLDDSAAGAATYYIDDIVIQTNIISAAKLARIEPLYPSADGTDTTGWGSGSGCSNWWECVDDLTAGGSADADSTYIATVNPPLGTDRSFALSNLAALADGESVIGVNTAALGKKTTNGQRLTATGVVSNGTADLGSFVDWDSFGDTTNYFAGSYSLAPLNPDGAVAWTATSVNAAEIELETSTGTGTRRATALVAEAAIAKPLPDVPTNLTDTNDDDLITFCWAGDSRMADAALSTAISTHVEQPDNLLKCSLGATSTPDLLASIDGILDGGTAQGMACSAVRGTTGNPCDVFAYDIGYNDTQPIFIRAREGYCFDNGGPDDGAPCRCETLLSCANPLLGCTGPVSRCTAGSTWKAECTPGTGTPCDNSLFCQSASCLNAAGCPTGVCFQEPGLATLFRVHEQIADAVAAHSANAKVIFVLPAWPNPNAVNPVFLDIVQGKSDILMAQWNWYKDQAARRGWNWIDLRSEFHARCRPWTACLRDPVHWSTTSIGDNPAGTTVAAELIAACLEQDASFPATAFSCDNL